MKKDKNKIQRAERGYIAYRKKHTFLYSTGIVVVALAIFFLGLLLNDMSKANIFTVLAVLCVLPWANQMVSLIIFLPYRSVKEERFQQAKEVTPEGVTLYSDLVITSPDKVMNLDYAAVGCGKVVALVGRKRQDVKYIQRYLAHCMQRVSNYSVEVLVDEEEFLQKLENIPPKDVDPEEHKKVVGYLMCLCV